MASASLQLQDGLEEIRMENLTNFITTLPHKSYFVLVARFNFKAMGVTTRRVGNREQPSYHLLSTLDGLSGILCPLSTAMAFLMLFLLESRWCLIILLLVLLISIHSENT